MTDDAETDNARRLLRERMIDPLWATADGYYPNAVDNDARGKIRGVARTRVRGYLADRLDIAYADCRVERFDLATCRHAWKILRGVTYADIRDWYKRVRRPPKGDKGHAARRGRATDS